MKREKHGMTRMPEYRAWSKMKGRCHDKNNENYENYGGRGIKVCESWLNSFEQFYSDMGPRPSSKHSIDRIENNMDYEQWNCRWATRKEQQNNTRANVLIKYQGKTKTRQEWCEYLGIGKECLRARLNRGWTIERAFNTTIKNKDI